MDNPLMFLLASIDVIIAIVLHRIALKANRRGINAVGLQLAILAIFCVLFGVTFMVLALIPNGSLKHFHP